MMTFLDLFTTVRCDGTSDPIFPLDIGRMLPGEPEVVGWVSVFMDGPERREGDFVMVPTWPTAMPDAHEKYARDLILAACGKPVPVHCGGVFSSQAYAAVRRLLRDGTEERLEIFVSPYAAVTAHLMMRASRFRLLPGLPTDRAIAIRDREDILVRPVLSDYSEGLAVLNDRKLVMVDFA